MAEAQQHGEVKVLQQLTVSPSPGTVPAISLPLTFFDITWLQAGCVDCIFFYNFPSSTSHFTGRVLPDLISSLSFALQHFFPLAGRVRLSPESTDQCELYYDPGPTASGEPFTVAESGDDFDYLVGDHDRHAILLRKLVPSLPMENNGVFSLPAKLLAIQATVFPGRGLSLGISNHHVVCDGSSFVNFLQTWANACRNINSSSTLPPPSPPPLFDRSVIADPEGLYSIYLEDIRKFAESMSKSAEIEPQQEIVLATFTMKKEVIEKLKAAVVAKRGDESKNPPFHFSTFVVACAYIWSCIVKSRIYDNKEEHVYCGEEGFVKAAEAIGRGGERLKKNPTENAERLVKVLLSLIRKRIVTVAGSTKFRFYDIHFGWGSPEKVEVVSIATSGAMSLAESKDEDGGVQVGVARSKSEMEHFRSHFAPGLDCL